MDPSVSRLELLVQGFARALSNLILVPILAGALALAFRRRSAEWWSDWRWAFAVLSVGIPDALNLIILGMLEKKVVAFEEFLGGLMVDAAVASLLARWFPLRRLVPPSRALAGPPSLPPEGLLAHWFRRRRLAALSRAPSASHPPQRPRGDAHEDEGPGGRDRPPADDAARRLRHLERENRRLKWAFALVGAVVAGGLVWSVGMPFVESWREPPEERLARWQIRAQRALQECESRALALYEARARAAKAANPGRITVEELDLLDLSSTTGEQGRSIVPEVRMPIPLSALLEECSKERDELEAAKLSVRLLRRR